MVLAILRVAVVLSLPLLMSASDTQDMGSAASHMVKYGSAETRPFCGETRALIKKFW
jgi:hypothetical protein